MGNNYNWNNLTDELLIAIALRLDSAEEYVKFKAVSKSWKSAVAKLQNPCLPPRRPWLLLAEEVAPGGILTHHAFDDNDVDDNDINSDKEYDDYDDSEDDHDGDDYNDEADDDGEVNDDGDDKDDDDDDEDGDGDSKDDDDDGDDDNEDDDEDNYDDSENDDVEGEDDYAKYIRDYLRDIWSRYDHRKNSIGSTRGIYSLSTGKTYTVELPEAAGRRIFGTNKGWLVTLGRDLQINLLHPLFRHQIPLPPMLTFPVQFEYDEYDTPEDRSDMFIKKVVLSSRVTTKYTDSSLPDEYHDPIVMAIYGQCGGKLGFARLGDKVWTGVDTTPCRCIKDIVYHNGKFYIVGWEDVFVCYTNDDNGGFKVRKIASVPIQAFGSRHLIYLVETLSGSGLLLIVRTWKNKLYKPPHRMRTKYRTIDFSVWKLELNYCECGDICSGSLTEENNLGNEAIFLGTTSSASVSPSETIRPNCIYFTDDKEDTSYHTGGGHDMGIFNMESRTIESHYQGKSLHPISPPLWYM